MPKINPTQKYPNQLTNGHTHLFMLNGKTGQWGSEAQVKYLLAKTIARGDRETMRIQKGTGMPKHYNTDPSCKIVYVLMGDSPANEWIADIKLVAASNAGRREQPAGHPGQRLADVQRADRPPEWQVEDPQRRYALLSRIREAA